MEAHVKKRFRKIKIKYRKYTKSSNVRTRDYQNPQNQEWRHKVLDRDEHHCQWPGCKTKSKLEIHHILKYCDYPHMRYDINNGITLCQKHHNMIKNNEEDFIILFYKVLLKQCEIDIDSERHTGGL